MPPLDFDYCPSMSEFKACDEEQCFPPATINTTISVIVK